MLDFLYNLILFPIEQIIEICYIFSFRATGSDSPGLAIVGVSVAVSILTLPLYYMAERHQRAERGIQRRMRPEIESIKAVFSGDERFMRLSTYYRQNGYHHLYSLRSSISLIIQIPFFIAAYHFLSNLEFIKGVAFGTIEDLAKPDSLLMLNGYVINVLPFVMTIINFASVAIYSKGLLPKDKIQLYGMAVIFLILLYNSPSGMVLYWTGNNIFSLLKNVLQKIGQKTLSFPSFQKRLSITKHKKPKKEILENNSNWGIFILGLFSLFLLFGLLIPSLLIASSAQEFSFIDEYDSPFNFIINTVFQSIGMFIFWPLCIYWMTSKRNKKYLLATVMVFIGIAMVNLFLFSGEYGYLTTSFTFSNMIDSSSQIKIYNLLAIFAVSAFVLLFVWRFKKVMLSSLIIIVCAFMILCTMNISKIKDEYKSLQAHYIEGRLNPGNAIYHLSKNGKNILVIMLDTAVSGFISYIFEEKPELNDSFDGFTWYRNTISFGTHTNFGSPALFGGYEYTPKEMNDRDSIPLVEKHNEALLLLPKIFLDHGYRISITDPSYSNYSYIADLSIFEDYPQMNANNVIGKYNEQWLKDKGADQQPIKLSTIIKSHLIRFAFFKTSPVLFRKGIYDEGRWLNIPNRPIDLDTANVSDRQLETINIPNRPLNNYITLDVLPDITRISRETQMNTYNVLTNDLPHDPWFLKLPDYVPSNTITDRGDGPFANDGHYHVNMASMLLLGKYFDFLKENDVYDNTRIIVVSDHGNMYCESPFDMALPNDEPLQAYAALLLVKDFNSHGVLSVNDEFMTNADVPFISLKNIIENPINPWTGKILKADKDNGVVITTSHLYQITQHPTNRFNIRSDEWLHVRDNIFDIENWSSVNR